MRSVWFFILVIACLGISAALHTSAALSPLMYPPSKHEEPGVFSIGWLGDMVPASDEAFNLSAFSNISALTQEPTLMIGNLEGTFAAPERVSKCSYMTSQCHAFRGNSSFAYSLKYAGFDVVSLANNHSFDYGDEGLSDTEAVLDGIGMPYVSQTHPSISIEKDGKKIGILGVSFTPGYATITDYAFITREIGTLREKNDIVIFIFHGGAEGSDKTAVTGEYEYLGKENRGNVQLAAQSAIDAGADMVLGSGPHVLRKVSYYKNKPIIYSAGNAVGGNGRLTTSGSLGLSALFTLSEQRGASFSHSLTSLILSKEGIPSIDQEGRARILLETLGQ